jgi:hypothetical protein
MAKSSKSKKSKSQQGKRAKLIENLEGRKLLASPLVITKGGDYSGEWESLDRNVPAVTVKTTEPVVIQNATIRGRGDLIASGTDHTNITVRNVKGYGLNPNVYGKVAGEFVDVQRFDNLVVEDSYMEQTAGINALNYLGDHTAADSVKITGNQALNIDGRKSDGNGGYLDFNKRKNKSTGASEQGFEFVQFVQFDKVYNVPGVEIAWNEVINLPGQSRVEDNISLYKSSGTSSSPIAIHDNYIQGAYTVNPTATIASDDTYTYDWSFSGGGIMLGDGVGSTAADDPAYVKAYGNTVVSTTNYGIAISAGHDMEFYDNRVVSAGVTASGQKLQKQNTGMYVWDSYDAGSSHFYNVSAHDNVAGWVKTDGSRNDWWTNVSSLMPDNVHMSGTITLATESAEHAAWQDRFAKGGGTVTPTPTPTPIPDPTPTPRPIPDPTPTPPTIDPPVVDQPPVIDPPVVTDPPVTEPPIVFPQPDEPDPVPPVAEEPVEPIQFGVSGTVYNDRDGDGIKETGDVGVADRIVFADLDNDGVLDTGEPSDKTDASGNYALTLDAGSYTIRQVTPTGWYQPAALKTAGRAANLVSSDAGGLNFSSTKYATLSGSVFKDADRDGTRDTGETGLAGWTVFIDANNNGWRDANERAVTTDANGNWRITNVKAGVHYVRIQQKDKSLVRTTGSYFKHAVFSGSSFSKDVFGYAPKLV